VDATLVFQSINQPSLEEAMQMNSQTESRMHAAGNETRQDSLAEVVHAKDQLVSDFGALASDAEELLKSTAKYSGENLNSARVKFRDNLEHFKGRLFSAQDAALSKANRAAAATNDYARENPWKVVGVAAALGVLLGVLLRRK
jgi:ElaB/YqjD/DUF883 family membrane-anchored ribosome-binding protein